MREEDPFPGDLGVWSSLLASQEEALVAMESR
jgi:hypothetical protein